jgi:minor histocompatibility antigen H13
MEEVSPFAEFLGHLCYHFRLVKPFLPVYGHILVSALFPIYVGAHASLSRPSSAAKPPSEDDDEKDSEEGEGQNRRQKIESLEPTDALMFPLMAGLTLSMLYLLLKWLGDPAILNKVMSFYFSQMGIYFMGIFLKDSLQVLRSFIFPRQYQQGGKIWDADQSQRVFTTCVQSGPSSKATETRRSPLPGVLGRFPLPAPIRSMLWFYRNLAYQQVKFQTHVRGVQKAKVLLGLFDVVSVVSALSATAYFTFVGKPWWLTNLLGFSFCYNTLQLLTPSTFWTGTLLLGSLFFYDIYFVFYTPIMVTVAKKLDAPIKLLFPRPPSPEEAEMPDAVSLAMLGLGDIVIPGMVMCLALRFDLFLYYKLKGVRKAQAEGKGSEAVKPEYQSATGGWGERFWSRAVPQSKEESEPPYHDARSFPKTYFKASIIGYTLGLVTTLIAMQYSGRGQPALLYLVPGVLLSLWGTALLKGDIRDMWNFSDAEEDEEDDGKKEEKPDETASKDTKSFFLRVFSGDLSVFSPKESNKSDKADKEEGKTKGEPTDSAGKKDSPDEKDSAAGTAAEEKQGDSSNKNADKDNEKDDDNKDVELFSLSISRPRKGESKKQEGPSENVEPASSEADSPADIAHAAERDDEPPAKRLRRSPRTASAA